MYYFEHIKQKNREQYENELQAIGDLKLKQLMSWRQERLDDASFIYNSETIADEIAKVCENPSRSTYRKQTLGWMTSMFKNHQYTSISLFDSHYKRVLSVNNENSESISHDPPYLRSAAQPKRILFSDLHTEVGRGVFIDIVVPVLRGRRVDSTVVGLVILMIDPNTVLYPLIQEWPVPSRTSESLLIRREGDDVVYLNALRHIKNVPLELRRPVDEEQLPAAMAARGVEGIVEGKDYRGVEVLAAVRRVPDSQWFLIAKLDAEEMNASVLRDEWLVSILIAALIVATGATIGFSWRTQNARFYRREYEAELERKALTAHYDYLTKLANDIVILISQDLRIVEPNDRALSAYGYSREELIRMHAGDLQAPEVFSQLDTVLKSIEEKNGLVYETLHRRKDGSIFPAEVSSRVIEIEGRRFYQSIIRDITERKNAEKKIKRLSRVYAVLSNINKAIVRLRDRQELFEETCRIAVEDGLFKLAWIGVVNDQTSLVEPIASAGMSVGYLERFRISVTNEPKGRGPAAIALRIGDHIVCNDIECDERMEPWREAALRLGFRSLVRFPIVMFDSVRAAISLYSGEKNFFDEEEINLLRGMSEDISYALESLKREEDRTLIDEALKKSELKYRELIIQAADGIFIADREWKILFVNPKSCEMLGYSEGELLRLNIKDTYAFDEMDNATRRMKDLQTRNALQFERKMRRKDGSVFPVEVNLRTLKDGTYQAIVHDITERKRSEEQLRLQSTALQSAANAIIITDSDGNVLWVNAAFTQLTGYSLDEINSKSTRVLKSGKQDLSFYKTLWNTILSGGIWHGEIVNKRKDGSLYDEEMTITPVRNDVGSITHFIAIKQDIAKRKKAEEDLREAEIRYRALFDESPDGIAVIDPETGVAIEFNEKVHTQLGYSKEEFARLRISDYEVLEKPEETKAHMEKVLREGKDDFETIQRTKSGHLRNVHVTVMTFKLHGKLLIYTIFRDITERKKAAVERKDLEAQLLQMQKMDSLGTLAGGIAHDFNNILSIVLGYSTLLERQKNNAERFSESIVAINQAVQRGANLVRQILTFARKTETAFEAADVNRIVKELLSMLMQTFPKIITFSQSLEEDLPLINADHSQLHQALLNLCVNARDAMPKGGVLSLSTQRVAGDEVRQRFSEATEERYMRVTVTDSGTGMSESVKKRVFEPFFTTKEQSKGTGLGLAVVYGVVQTHHGFIDVATEMGKGTSFHVYLPIPSVWSEHLEVEKRMEEVVPHGTEAILLVEDEELLLSMMEVLLEQNGYRVFTASDGKEAIAMYELHKNEIKLVLTDLGLPRLSGIEEFMRLKEIDPELKVILASGFFDPELKADLLKAGARAFIQKPYVPNEVLKMIREVLDS
jgi:nitrogen fixation negative regulator NifL